MGAKITTLVDMEGNPIAPRTGAEAVVTASGESVEDALLKKMGFELLWTNPSPTSSFPAQTRSWDLSEYDFVLIEASDNNTSDPAFMHFLGKKGNKTRILLMYNSRQVREFTFDDTGITFRDGYEGGTTTSVAVANTRAIPHKIYGIK